MCEERGHATIVVTYGGVVENGSIRLPRGVLLPENAKVYVVVPEVVIEVETPRVARVPSPRLVHPEQAVDFIKEVIPESSDAGV